MGTGGLSVLIIGHTDWAGVSGRLLSGSSAGVGAGDPGRLGIIHSLYVCGHMLGGTCGLPPKGSPDNTAVLGGSVL